MKKSLIAATLLLASSSAFSGIITATTSFGTQGSSDDINIGLLSETLSIASFDTTLGSLTNVEIIVYGQLDSDGTSTNYSTANARAEVSLYLTSDWLVSTSAADNYIFAIADDTTPILVTESTTVGNYDLATDNTFNFNISTGELSYSLTNINFAAFTAGTSVDFLFSTTATTQFNNDINSGTGSFSNGITTGSWGQVEVIYSYDAVTVPEPSSLAILALGLVGLAASRQKKRFNLYHTEKFNSLTR